MRDKSLDNLKFILISLVIIGHIIEPLLQRFEWAKSVYVYIYLFHMPMFAYVSGVVSSRRIDEKLVYNCVKNIVVPYFFLELSYSVFDYYIFSKKTLTISPLVPNWILWYLFSLLLWRLLLPIYSQFKFPFILSIITGLACGFNSYDYNLSFSRTFVFFPFFIFGSYYHFLIYRKINDFGLSKLIGSGVLIAIFFVLLNYSGIVELNLGWLYGSKSYSRIGVDWEYGVLIRLSIYLLTSLIGGALLSIIPKKEYIWTRYGRDTLYIYVLHGFVMKILLVSGLYKHIDSNWKVLFLMSTSLILLPLLSLRYSKLIARILMNPLQITDVLIIKKKFG